MIAPVEMPLSLDLAAALLAAAASDDAEAEAVIIWVMTLTSPPGSVVTVVRASDAAALLDSVDDEGADVMLAEVEDSFVLTEADDRVVLTPTLGSSEDDEMSDEVVDGEMMADDAEVVVREDVELVMALVVDERVEDVATEVLFDCLSATRLY